MAQPQVGEIIDGYRFNGGDPGSQESWSQGPSAGDVVDGYKFKGGDPSDEASWSVAKAENKGFISSVAEAVGWKKGNDFKVPEGQVVTENTFTAGMPEEEAKPKRNIAMENSLMRGMDGTPATEQTAAVSDLPSVKKVSKPVSNFERQKESNRKWLDNSKALVVDQLISDNNLSPEDANFEFSRMRSYGVVPNATETGLRESTWGEAFDSGIAKVKPSFDKSMAGLASAKADATGDFDLANVADALRKTANAQLAEAEGILAGTSKDSWKKTISDAPASIAQNLPTIIAASAVASNPLLAGVIGNIGLAGMGMVSAGTAYSEGKDTGLNVSNNMQQSVLTGLAEVIPEKMSLNVLIGALGKNAAKQAMSDSIVQSAKTLGKYIGTEIGTEEITTIANFGINKMYSKPDMPIKELVSQMIDTAKATLIQAPILGGAGIVTKAAVDASGRVVDPVGYQLRGYADAVERTNFAPMQSDGNTQAADAAKQSAMNAWSNGLAGAPKPTVKDITAAPDLDSAIRAAESVIADVAPVTIPDAPVQPPAPVAQIDPEIAALNQEATKIDQGKLLADIEAHINPTGTLTVTGKGAADAVRSLGEEIPFVQHKDGSVLVSARFAEPVSLAIQQAQQLTKPLGQTFTPMPIPATVASTLDANPIRPQTIAGQSAETYTDEQLAEITQSVTTNIDTRKGAAIELQARSVGQSTEPVVEQQPQPMQPTPVIESPVVSQPQRAKSKALKFTGNIINDLKVLGVNPRMLSRIVTDGTRATESIDDLSELAYRLRNELGYMFDDVNNDASQGLVEYLRRVSNNEVSPLNASRMEQDIADREEYLNKQSVIERAKELGLKGIGGKRTLAVVEADIARVEQERDDMEAREERAAIQAESAASEAFVADDAPMSEDDFRKYFAQSASVEYTQEDIDRAIEYQTNRENDRAEAATGYASEGETQGDSGQRNQDGETQEGTRGTAEERFSLAPADPVYFKKEGDFWNYYGPNAQKIARAIGVTATKKNGKAMIGFPDTAKALMQDDIRRAGYNVIFEGEEGLTLTGETNQEASANAARKIDPNALTKEEINAQSAGFGLQQQEGAPKPGPEQDGLVFEESAVYTVNEPDAITGDLFQGTENALPENKRKDLHRTKKSTQMGVGASPAQPATVLAIRQSKDVDGIYNVSTQLVTVGERNLPTNRVNSWHDAALAFSGLTRYAVEHFDALITDTNGIPLAIIGGFKGAPTMASVFPSTVMMELSRIEGAAHVWAGHNHPSGNPGLSGADRNISSVFESILKNSGVEYHGLSAVARAGDTISWESTTYDSGSVSAGAPNKYSVPIVEREIIESNPGAVVSSPSSAKSIVSGVAKSEPGIVFLTAQNAVSAFVPFDPGAMGELRKDDRLMRLFGAASKSGGAGAIIAMPDGLVTPKQYANIRGALGTIDVNVIDGIEYKSDGSGVATSLAERGLDGSAGAAFYSKGAMQGESITEAEATTAITSKLGNAAKVLIDAGQIVLVRTEEGLRNLAGAKFMTAWHGSPHDHDKFDSSKIGTGEGAQAYGYGLYFASKREVADGYRIALTSSNAKKQFSVASAIAAGKWYSSGMVVNGTKYYSRMDLQGDIESQKLTSMDMPLDVMTVFADKLSEPNGKLYQVELAPSEDEYLDWDKPLSEQSEFVQKALGISPDDAKRYAEITERLNTLSWENDGLDSKEWNALVDEAKSIRSKSDIALDGNDFYAKLKNDLADKAAEGTSKSYYKDERWAKAASDYLHSIGIRGIRYLDGSSRGAGEGNSNYVIFSDDDVSITAKYAKQQGAIQGATLPDGRIVLVLDNLNKDNIGGVLEHEGFHSSIKQLLGEKTYDQLMTRLDQLSKLNKSWAAQAEKSIPADTKPENWLEEIGAYAIEIYNRGEQLPGSIRKWVEDFLSAIRSAIISSKHMPERAKMIAMKALKPQDLSRLAIAGLKAKANGIQTQGAGRMAYSKINQTSTAAFKKWFGDWSDPKAFSSKYPKDKTPVSQAVGDDGKPLILYHATNGDFNTFEPGRPTINSTTFGDVETERHGIFAAVDVKFAEEYLRSGSGKNVMSIYMDIKAPMDMREGPDGEHIRDIVENSDGKIRHNDFYNLPATETWSLFDGDFGETFVAAAKKAGYDGAIILENTGDRESSKEVYVAFDPTQIKSATGNNGDFDGRNPDIRYSRAVVNQPSAFNLPEWTRRDTVQQRVQDRYNRIRDVIKAVRNQGGNVNDLNDFSMGEDRFHGVAMERVNNIQDRLQSLLDEAKAKDITMEEVTMFAYAEHAPSRNAAMQAINPNVTTGSGMSDQEAADIIAAADKEGKKADLEALTAKMREIAKDTMARQVSSGLTPQSEADVYQAKYGDKWVPLRGFETIDAEGNTFRGTGKGFNIRGKENLRALGRDSKAGQILENILLDAERTAIRSTKNTEVNHRFLRFVMDNPDKNLWEVDAVKTNRSLRGDKVKEDLVIDKSDNTIGMKVQGEMVYVKIHDNHLFEQLANQWNDIEMNGIPYLQDFSRYLAKSYTAWSPEFALYTNPARDIQAALFSITGREGIGMAGKFAKAYPKALKMAYNSEVKGNDDPLYAEYKAQGGKTGFWNHNNLETKVKEIETLIKDMEATAGKNPFRYSLKMLKALEAIVSNHAGALENATRFASYIAMREAGKSREEAASFAKNLNVNFNRRGTWTAGIGSVVLFFNPAIQGIHNQYETLVHGKHKKQAWALMGAHIGAMAALALLNAAGGEDDDGVKWWDKIPDYEKERNMILVLPPYMKTLGTKIEDSTGRYLKIPMPYQWNIGAYAGTLMADTYRNSENPAEGTTLGKGALLLSKATATAYMPAGMPPTIAPFYQHMANKKAFGDGPLYPESPWNAHKPDSEKYSAKQKDTAWQEWASFVNEATGGNQFKEGRVSIPPAVWKNYVKTYLGGPMSFVEGIYDASAEDDITKAPFIRKAYGEVGLNADAGKFYQTTEKPIEAAKAYKDASKSDPKYAKEMMQSEKVMIQLGELALNYKEQLGKVTKDDIRIKDNVDYTDAEKRLKLKINEKRRSDYQEEYLAKQRQKLGDASVK